MEHDLHLALEQGADTVGFVMNAVQRLGAWEVQWITITHALLSTKDFSVQQYWQQLRLEYQHWFWSGTVLYLDQSAAQRWADVANQMLFWSRLRRPSRSTILA
jgi:hypothetical protein